MDTFDALHLARLQFAFTVAVHIIFPAISIGMASFLAVLEWRFIRPEEARLKAKFGAEFTDWAARVRRWV